jgi:hypothetical protein
MALLARFGVRIPAKSTVEALLLPLLGQFQSIYSRQPAHLWSYRPDFLEGHL